MTNSVSNISLIVNTYQKPRHLSLVLESILLQQDVAGRMEVIVTDDGSTDDTPAIVAAYAATAPFPIRFITQPHDGFRLAQVRNRGARIATGDSLLFLDGDCILPRDHVAADLGRRRPSTAQLGYCARLSEETLHSLVPGRLGEIDLVSLAPPAERRLLAQRHRKAAWHSLVRHPSKPRLAGGNFGVWRTDFERVNGFDERFVGWGQEDDDLGLRLRSIGVRLESILDRTFSLHVWHPSDTSATTRWRDGTNVNYFLRRGRLTSCRQGLVPRPIESLCWGLPKDLIATALGSQLSHLLAGAPCAHPGESCEIDIVIRPGVGRFLRPAECRLVLASHGTGSDWWLRRRADRIEIIPSNQNPENYLPTLAALLSHVG